MKRSGFLLRFPALLLDLIIGTLGSVLILFVFFLLDASAHSTSGLIEDFVRWIDLQKLEQYQRQQQVAAVPGVTMLHGTLLLFSLGYASMEYFFQASVGKMIVGLQIRNSKGGEASDGQLVTRLVLKYPNVLFIPLPVFAAIHPFLMFVGVIALGLFCVAFFIGLFGVFFPAKRTLYDIISGTAVYYVRGAGNGGRPRVEQQPLGGLGSPRSDKATNELIFK